MEIIHALFCLANGERLLLGDVATIDVGIPPTAFKIHENLLVARSGFFRGALRGNFLEYHTRTIAISWLDVENFTYLVSWLYTGTLHNVFALENLTSSRFSSCVRRTFELWLLDDQLQIPQLQNQLASGLINCLPRFHNLPPVPDNETLGLVYANTIASSPVRRLAVDLAVATRLMTDLEEYLEHLSDEIVRDICVAAIHFWKADARHTPNRRRQYLMDEKAKEKYDVAPLPDLPSLTQA